MATREPCGAGKIAETCTYQSRHLVPRILVTSRGSCWRLRDYGKVAFGNLPRDRRWKLSWRARVTWNVGTISSLKRYSDHKMVVRPRVGVETREIRESKGGRELAGC